MGGAYLEEKVESGGAERVQSYERPRFIVSMIFFLKIRT